jgi:hypothetical protein
MIVRDDFRVVVVPIVESCTIPLLFAYKACTVTNYPDKSSFMLHLPPNLSTIVGSSLLSRLYRRLLDHPKLQAPSRATRDAGTRGYSLVSSFPFQ